MTRGQNPGRGDGGRSPTFVRASELYDVERSERVPFEWIIEGGGTP